MASSSLDSGFPKLNIQSGCTDDLAKEGVGIPKIDTGAVVGLAMALGISDNAASPINCSVAYQVSLVSSSTGIAELLTNTVNWPKVMADSLANPLRSQNYFTQAIAGPIFYVIDSAARIFGKIADIALGVVNGSNAVLGSIAQSELMFNALNFFLMGTLRKHKRIIEYANNYKYQVGIPSPSEAASAWLANEIDDCTFQAYVMAGDYKYDPFVAVTRASKFKFSALELTQLDMRKGIVRSNYNARLRELGSLHAEDVKELQSLACQIPGPGDLIRFMVRDTANQQVVQDFGLDTGFDTNYTGQIKTWSQYQGLSDEIMQNEWRAHWSIPAPTQLYEILHRLRHNPNYPGPDQVTKWVEDALKQQDILPFWIPKLMDISYHQLTRTDLFRVYERGWIDDDKFTSGMYQNGYSDADAPQMLKFAKNERKLAIKSSDFGVKFISGHISMGQALDMAVEEGWDESVTSDISAVLQPLQDLELQGRQVDAIIRQYKKCLISKDDVNKTASQLGIPQQVIAWQMQWADENSTCGTKREAVSALCTALSQEIITASEYISRMKLLKYDDTAIQTYLTLCQNKIQAARVKAQLAQQKAADKAAKQEADAAKKAQKDAQAQQNRLARQLASAERSRQARNKALEDAAFIIDATLSDADGNGATIVKGLYLQVQELYGLSQNEAANVVRQQASVVKGMSTSTYAQTVMEAAQAGLAEPWLLWPSGGVA